MSASRRIAASVLPDISMLANPSAIPHKSVKAYRMASAPAAPVLSNVASMSNSTSFIVLCIPRTHRTPAGGTSSRRTKIQRDETAGLTSQDPVEEQPILRHRHGSHERDFFVKNHRR